MNWLFVIAIVLLILIPFMPRLVRLRIRLLRWLHWSWAANLLEKHFQTWVLVFRIVLIVATAVFLYIGLVN
jgi:hypothetical protein